MASKAWIWHQYDHLIMGNTAETILEQLDCAVLAIKPQGFVTPVELDE